MSPWLLNSCIVKCMMNVSGNTKGVVIDMQQMLDWMMQAKKIYLEIIFFKECLSLIIFAQPIWSCRVGTLQVPLRTSKVYLVCSSTCTLERGPLPQKSKSSHSAVDKKCHEDLILHPGLWWERARPLASMLLPSFNFFKVLLMLFFCCCKPSRVIDSQMT